MNYKKYTFQGTTQRNKLPAVSWRLPPSTPLRNDWGKDVEL